MPTQCRKERLGSKKPPKLVALRIVLIIDKTQFCRDVLRVERLCMNYYNFLIVNIRN